MPKGKRLTIKQKGFVRDYLETGNASEAAERNYNVANRTVAGAIGVENLQKPLIQDALKNMAEEAILRIEELAKTAEKEETRLRANIDLADRGGFKAVERTHNISEQVNINISNEEFTTILSQYGIKRGTKETNA